ncbi:efflux RND transporter periplasmic adaptor subunit [Hyphomonas sp. WL0036]|uniref:efflux RND transporter periplasmic adaptor subunit n=1 Tax=Hyphomonas sediminis TaxID=2866160 RepID=UPI001C81D931|nr:efflux RND transporter periplasmic adaptor subunit [Hyphomonas sediminis]MBY9067671.1 efflux RND transporter periplasmic adaptor subunit [Hyphomonas sediminis]
MTTETDYEEAETGRRRRPTFLKGLLFLFLLAIVLAGLGAAAWTLRSAEGPKIATVEPEPLTVSVVEVKYLDQLDVEELYTGLAEARRTSRLGFQTGGRIDMIGVRVGDRVKAGQTLARLDTRGLGAQLASAQAVVEEARAGHKLALDTADRQRALMAQGHVSQQRVDEAVAQAATAMARVEAARAQADTLRVQIDLASIAAPYDGVIVSRFADEGTIAGPAQSILELVEAGDLEARIGVPARIVPELVAGNVYTLEAEIGPVDAVLRNVTGVVDATQRTVAAVFEIPAASGVPAGSIVRLQMERKLEEKGFWVPLKALASANRGMWTVYAVVAEGDGWRAQPRLVEMVYPAGDKAFVRGPIEPGERIIVDGLQRVTPGMPVLPREAQSAETVNGG